MSAENRRVSRSSCPDNPGDTDSGSCHPRGSARRICPRSRRCQDSRCSSSALLGRREETCIMYDTDTRIGSLTHSRRTACRPSRVDSCTPRAPRSRRSRSRDRGNTCHTGRQSSPPCSCNGCIINQSKYGYGSVSHLPTLAWLAAVSMLLAAVGGAECCEREREDQLKMSSVAGRQGEAVLPVWHSRPV